ncbi:monovalent cation/H+ antiporter complex subunit F [Terricaulis sp.]|uniref:monovalent cation/H+ antiporter complex subunit F n=1 Tax=Terricaulis sp. TaxID=2768686 RepID=UPI003783A808
MIALAAAAGMVLAMVLILVRMFSGPTLYDRTLAANSMLMKAALLCAAVAVMVGQQAWLDVAFALVFGGFVLSIAVLKFFRARTFQAPLARARENA